ncbi:MAG: multicopper oxidase domain-containing protein [Parcubacteria group bacterium]|nr:multicopper oxidase domain-containing protein [Parcubacteria group bacterium]
MKKYWIFIIIGVLVFGVVIYQAIKASQKKLPAKAVDVADISRRADDLPGPITRKDNQKVVFNLETKEVVAEIMPGVTYEYWTFDGTVPGPFMRVKEGDDVEIRLTHKGHGHMMNNHSDHSLAINNFFISDANANGVHDEANGEGHEKHSIDLHAVIGPGGGAALTQAKEGETLTFQFKATRPGLYVYHCASAHIPTHVANGMYGLILVEPKEGIAPVDREFYVMQGEFYTRGEFDQKGHQEFDLEKLKAERPGYFVFNGRVKALADAGSLKAKVGETIRIFFGLGSFIPSNFHLIGGIWDKLYPEGDIISPPHRNIQTTLVPAGGSMMAEFKIDVPGKYLLVDHSLSRSIDKGALGELIIEGAENPELFKKVE